MNTFYQVTRPDDPKTMITLKGCAYCGSEPIFSLKRGGYRLSCVKRFSGCPMNARTHGAELIDEAIRRWEIRAGDKVEGIPPLKTAAVKTQRNFNADGLLGARLDGRFELKVSTNGKYHFNLKAQNGQIILMSEMYESKSAAENGIASVQRNAGDDQRYCRRASSNGKPFFELKAANGQVVGKSEMYESTAAMENGIESVKKNAVGAFTVDA